MRSRARATALFAVVGTMFLGCGSASSPSGNVAPPPATLPSVEGGAGAATATATSTADPSSADDADEEKKRVATPKPCSTCTVFKLPSWYTPDPTYDAFVHAFLQQGGQLPEGHALGMAEFLDESAQRTHVVQFVSDKPFEAQNDHWVFSLIGTRGNKDEVFSVVGPYWSERGEYTCDSTSSFSFTYSTSANPKDTRGSEFVRGSQGLCNVRVNRAARPGDFVEVVHGRLPDRAARNGVTIARAAFYLRAAPANEAKPSKAGSDSKGGSTLKGAPPPATPPRIPLPR